MTINTLEVLNELSFDHNPVLIEIDLDRNCSNLTNRMTKTTNWALFRQTINDSIPANVIIQTKDELDIATQTFINTIQHTYLESTTTAKTQ